MKITRLAAGAGAVALLAAAGAAFGATTAASAAPVSPISNWYVEDVAPTQDASGLTFTGAPGGGSTAVDIYHSVTGPLSTATGMGYTITQATGPSVAYALEVNPGVDIDGDGNVNTYATLSFEPYVQGGDVAQKGRFATDGGLWWSSRVPNTEPGSQAHPQSLAAFEAEWPSATLISYGLHLGSNAAGAASTVSSITWQGATTRLSAGAAATNQECAAPADGGTETNLDAAGWGAFDNGAAGHDEFVSGGVHLSTDDATSDADVSQLRSAGLPLSQVGTLAEQYTSTLGTEPGIDLHVDFDNDGTADGWLIYEPVYGQDLWANSTARTWLDSHDGAPDISGGNGSSEHGTINGWLSLYPNAHVTEVGYELGSGVHGDGVLHSITVGCTIYSFDHAAPSVASVSDPASVSSTSAGTGELANTGSDVGLPMVAGAGVLFAGGILLTVALLRRRRQA